MSDIEILCLIHVITILFHWFIFIVLYDNNKFSEISFFLFMVLVPAFSQILIFYHFTDGENDWHFKNISRLSVVIEMLPIISLLGLYFLM